jgi:prepilin-type processing-associated H-X9-DG protein
MGEGIREFAWDFSSARNCNYSYQAPIGNSEVGGWVSGVDAKTSSDVPIMADRSPYATASGNVQPANAADLRDARQRDPHVSPNHPRRQKGVWCWSHWTGPYMNVLYADSHVSDAERPDVGYAGPDGDEPPDNIFTASGDTNGGSQTSISLDPKQHFSDKDSFLVGPR